MMRQSVSPRLLDSRRAYALKCDTQKRCVFGINANLTADIFAVLLRSIGIVKGRFDVLRVLGVGELTKPLTIRANHLTASEKLEAAGATMELIVKVNYSGRKPKVVAQTTEETTTEA